MEKSITFTSISKHDNVKDSKEFWMSKTPAERIEAVETLREHYYTMLGYTETPRIKKTIKII